MAKNLKVFISGLLAGILIMAASPVYSYVKQYILTDTAYDIYINGKKLKASEQFPVLNYNGTTYLSLAQISETLNVNLNWDSYAGRVVISSRGLDEAKPGNTADTVAAKSDIFNFISAKTGEIMNFTGSDSYSHSMATNMIYRDDETNSYYFDISGKINSDSYGPKGKKINILYHIKDGRLYEEIKTTESFFEHKNLINTLLTEPIKEKTSWLYTGNTLDGDRSKVNAVIEKVEQGADGRKITVNYTTYLNGQNAPSYKETRVFEEGIGMTSYKYISNDQSSKEYKLFNTDKSSSQKVDLNTLSPYEEIYSKFLMDLSLKDTKSIIENISDNFEKMPRYINSEITVNLLSILNGQKSQENMQDYQKNYNEIAENIMLWPFKKDAPSKGFSIKYKDTYDEMMELWNKGYTIIIKNNKINIEVNYGNYIKYLDLMDNITGDFITAAALETEKISVYEGVLLQSMDVAAERCSLFLEVSRSTSDTKIKEICKKFTDEYRKGIKNKVISFYQQPVIDAFEENSLYMSLIRIESKYADNKIKELIGKIKSVIKNYSGEERIKKLTEI